MATPYGGTRSKSFSTSQLRLGRTESLKEFAQVLQKQTTGRIRQTAEGFGRSAVSAALAPLPAPLQASMYGMLTSNPFSSSGDAESTVERISDDIDNLKNPTWAKNILRLFKEPLPVRIVEDKLGLLESKRESMIDITPTVERVEEDEKEEKKGFFGRLFDGFKKLFKFDGGLGKFLTGILGGAGALALGALKFAKGVGLVGLLGTILFNDRIIKILTDDFTDIAEKMNVSETTAKILYFLTGSQEGSLQNALENGAKWLAVGALAGWAVGGPPGILAGAIVMGALGALGGAMGADTLADITNFVTTMWNKGWNKARLDWVASNKEDVSKQMTETEELLKQAKADGDVVKVYELQKQLYELNAEYRAAETKEYQLRIAAAEDEMERIKESIETKEKQMGAFRNILDPENKAEQNLIRMITERFEEEGVDPSSMNLPGLETLKTMTQDEFKTYVGEIRKELLEELDKKNLAMSRAVIDEMPKETYDKLDEETLELENQLEMLKNYTDSAGFFVQSYQNVVSRRGKDAQSALRMQAQIQSDPELEAYVSEITGLKAGEVTGVNLMEYLKDPKNEKMFFEKLEEFFSEDKKQYESLLNIQRGIIEETKEKQDESTSSYPVPTNPTDTLIPAIELSSKSVDMLSNAFAAGPGPANVISNSGNTSVVEGDKKNIEYKTFIQQFNTPSDYLAFGG